MLGALEPNETAREAAIREAKEETGLNVEIISWLADYPDEYSYRRYYLAQRIGGTPTRRDKDGNRSVRVTLVPFEEALKRLTSEYDIAALKLCLERP